MTSLYQLHRNKRAAPAAPAPTSLTALFPLESLSEDVSPIDSLSYRIRKQYHYWPSGHLMNKGNTSATRGRGRPNTPGRVMWLMDPKGCYALFKPPGSDNLGLHRGVWMWHHGEIPAGLDIDHINLDKTDNRIENLRLCTRSQNMANTGSRARTKNPGLPKNVQLMEGKLRALVTKDGKLHYRGPFATVEEAVIAATALRTELHGEFARHQ